MTAIASVKRGSESHINLLLLYNIPHACRKALQATCGYNNVQWLPALGAGFYLMLAL